MDVVYGALLREYAVGSEVPIRIEDSGNRWKSNRGF